jgi:CubicO group peptidase (beta-lactamase class C family)
MFCWLKALDTLISRKRSPADPQTVYRIGSVTKAFTALMLMQLRDAGKLQLDDPIEKYLPEFKIKSRFPDARPATFRQVAAHYSGLPREAPMPYEYQATDSFPSVEDQLKSLKDPIRDDGARHDHVFVLKPRVRHYGSSPVSGC